MSENNPENQSSTTRKQPLIGILALQGDVREHARAVQACGAAVTSVRRPSELAAVDGLILPGGESTTIDKLTRIFGLRDPLRDRIAAGLPVYGSCAGMILLANEIADPAKDRDGNAQQTLGGLDITVRRNAFGRQVDSFETALDFTGLAPVGEAETPVHAVFIRAPWVERVGASVQVLASVEKRAATEGATQAGAQNDRIVAEVRAVAVRSQHLLATSFHPEVTGERRIHELFIRMIRGEA
ncbi:glutamine amidotransferase [Arthrobacter alpinus]|uniref:Pyridoxal 5'-phosphate synthase subunit PdxT n=1 Tax=Arthrobacter alpinus TaxID=656366 RepID=A0A0M4QFH1_9MICC|nr:MULTISPECIES: pyridoxal 5'-phosphate synthase glutaminase subunit PdxT [Arthrobacter]ALE92242.1 glutamine amidotransferase [Arthrobacter alpinus]